MQVKPESTGLLSELGQGAAGMDNLQVKGDQSLVGEFGKLLDQAAGDLTNKDGNEELLNLLASTSESEKTLATEGMGKIVDTTTPLTEEQLGQKLAALTSRNPLQGTMPGFESHNKLMSPELQAQFALEKAQNASSKVSSGEGANLKSILNGETPNLVKEENVNPLKKVNSQSSSDFLNQLKTAQSNKVTDANLNAMKMENQKSQVNLYGKKQNAINKNLISLKKESDTSELINSSNINLMDQAELKLAQTSTAVRPVVDLSSVNAENKVELINKITNYIEQSNISNAENVDVLVKHDELGTFQITAKKGATSEMVDLKINTLSENGRTFFVENEAELLKSLNQNGIKIADLKISSSKDFLGMADMKGQTSDRSFDGNSSNQGNQGQRNFGQNSSGNEDSQRRRNLWQQFSEQQQAYA